MAKTTVRLPPNLSAQMFQGSCYTYVRGPKRRQQRMAHSADAISSSFEEEMGYKEQDDVLNYIGPTLAKHQNCDVIDINPGVCLWSTKLHDYLQPRTHLLLEPNEHFFDPFIKPLLERPGSKFRHAFFNTEDWDTYRRIFKEGYIQPSSQSSSEPSRVNESNDSLLVVGNFAYAPRTPVLGFDSLAHLAVNHLFCKALRQHSYIHSYGRVRMLLWMTHEDTFKILPQDVFQRGKFTVDQEMSGLVTMVAGPGKLSAKIGIANLETANMKRVVQNMNCDNISLPLHRQTLGYPEAHDSSSQGTQLALEPPDPRPTKRQILLRWEDEREFASLTQKYKKTRASKSERSADPGWQRYLQLRNTYSTISSAYKYLDPLATLNNEVLQLELALTTENVSDEDKDRMVEEWKGKSGELKFRQSKLSFSRRHQFEVIVDNLFAREREASLLQWDRRQFEPLRAEEDEFYPSNDLCLLDFQPGSPLIFSGDDDSENAKLATWLLTHLFLKSSRPIPMALESCAPGAADALLPQAPSITDPRKGGRLDPSELRVRLLTLEMIEELVRAWIDWPFRPSLGELIPTGTLRERFSRAEKRV
ncbi:MAG: hypothetical protein M1821_004484 [Bathelium mastoideum]|nr:MAG: hypothetical protein M1821_004484 [Bathelium mastoideum]